MQPFKMELKEDQKTGPIGGPDTKGILKQDVKSSSKAKNGIKKQKF